MRQFVDGGGKGAATSENFLFSEDDRRNLSRVGQAGNHRTDGSRGKAGVVVDSQNDPKPALPGKVQILFRKTEADAGLEILPRSANDKQVQADPADAAPRQLPPEMVFDAVQEAIFLRPDPEGPLRLGDFGPIRRDITLHRHLAQILEVQNRDPAFGFE
ncbi:MAG: hypothetical protein BWY66_01812 [bacterium ADurb.Bin374]|nr:MAG: hypothetical protein BWY66_01812 [bacterium ADurb.Bin374]